MTAVGAEGGGRSPWTLLAVAGQCAALGAMFGAGALGAARASGAAVRAASPATPRLTLEAIGVLREIAPDQESPSITEWLAGAMASLDAAESASREGARPQGRARSGGRAGGAGSSGGGVTSDNVPAGAAQGYVDGRAVRITVTRLDGKPVEVRTALAFERMRAAAARDGVSVRIVSGFRTMEHQQALYAAYRRGRGNLAARPGESNHQSGHALDLNTSSPGVLRWLERNARRYGFRRTVPSEAWHWEWW